MLNALAGEQSHKTIAAYTASSQIGMKYMSRQSLLDPAMLFDLDGTLVDTVYQHVTAWSAALRSEGILVPNWKIHRRIGMSGKSLVNQFIATVL